MLQHQKDRTRHDIITLDESWFSFTTDHERVWLPGAIEALERERIIVRSRKMMAIIAWNPTGFYRIVALPKGIKFNADYYIFYMLDSLAEWRWTQVGVSDRRLHVHADSAWLLIAKKITEFLAGNNMKRTPHPPYSLDLAPCDFYIFGYIKRRLACVSFEEPDQLLPAIDAMF
jgi:hypothetical protein